MKVIVPGHVYHLETYDIPLDSMAPVQWLGFMRRIGPGYPGNLDTAAGTNCQEVIRVLIDRVKYLDKQNSCYENLRILTLLRMALQEFENRARRMRVQAIPRLDLRCIETFPTCPICGHILCKEHSNDR